MCGLPRLGLEPMSLALAGGFLTAAPPGKSLALNFEGTQFKSVTVYIESPKEFAILLNLVSEFSKVAGHWINTQKLITSPYTNNKHEDIEIKNSVPLAVTPET